MKNWKNNRPDGWVDISNDAVAELKKQGIEFNPACFIAGADAMLEALKVEGFKCVFEGWHPIKGGSTADAPRYALTVQSSMETQDNTTIISRPPITPYIQRRKGVAVFIPEEKE